MLDKSISIAQYRELLASGAKAKPSRRTQPEEDLHRACVEWAAFNQARIARLKWLIHIPNGGKRSKGEAGKMKAMGVKKGVIDLMLPRPSPLRRWQGLAIELKSTTGKLSPDQEAWLAAHQEDGWLTGVARTLENFIALVDAYASDASIATLSSNGREETRSWQGADEPKRGARRLAGFEGADAGRVTGGCGSEGDANRREPARCGARSAAAVG